MAKLQEKFLDGNHAPDKEFWENDLELGLEHSLGNFNDAAVARWLTRLSSRQMKVLRNALKLRPVKQGLSNGIPKSATKLAPYFLVLKMAAYKSRVAVSEYAEAVLDCETLEACRKSDDFYDVGSLMLALYEHDWAHLPRVFQLEKIHKTGFAQMKLGQKVRKAKHADFRKFLSSRDDGIGRSLESFDATQRDTRKSELMGTPTWNDGDLVFVRRPFRPRHVIRDKRTFHGYSPEWLILNFRDGAKRVEIAASSDGIPLQLANRIATDFFQQDCTYENESCPTQEAQVRRFLTKLCQQRDDELKLVEIVLLHCPLKSSPKMRLSANGQASLGPAIDHLDNAFGPLLNNVREIESIKVSFRKKRVSLKIEQDDSVFEVRYSDYRLNATERRTFESYMQGRHGIQVKSTEKQFTKP